jgi:putative colanic acid biosynthesis acetyltransferase WcaF
MSSEREVFMELNATLNDSPDSLGLESQQAKLKLAYRMNYSRSEYVARILWRICWFTVWQLCWKRLHPLRPLLLRLFGAKMSLRNEFDRRTWIEIPWNLEMGELCAVGFGATLYNLGPLKIGNRTVISRGAFICGGTHDYTCDSMPLVKTPIAIGSDVWICAEAFVGPGVTIGDGVVVGARAVVVGSVPPWTVVAGNPARMIKRRILHKD